MASDKEIGELLASGRTVQAFEMLTNAFQHKIFRLAFAMLGVRSAAEAARHVSQAPLPDIERMVAELPDECRSAVMLYYMEEKSYEQASRALGIPLGTLKTRLHRARKLLAGKLVTMKKGDSGDAVRRV